jgi:O-antigen ligase
MTFADVVIYVSTAALILLSVTDWFFRKEYAMIFLLTSNPYAAGFILAVKIFKNINISRRALLIFLVFMIALLASIMPRLNIDFQTVMQFTQLSILVFFVTHIAFSRNINSIFNKAKIIKSLLLSVTLLAILKIIAYFLGYEDFKINGLNEDSFFLVILGVFCGIMFFKKVTLFSFFYCFILFYSLFLYESRSALIMLLIPFIVFPYIYKKYVGIIVTILAIIIFINFFNEFITLFAQLFDVEKNHSNMERFNMYVYSYNFLIGSEPIYGAGNLSLAMRDMKAEGVILGEYPHPHSVVLRFLLEMGYMGLAILTLFYIWIFQKFLKQYALNKKIAFLILIYLIYLILFGFVNSIFYSFYRGVVTIFILFLLTSENRRRCAPPVSG